VTLAQRQNLNTNDTARLLAMVSLAGADASIALTNEKNDWNTWRPITAIREADYDGNPATTPDPEWTPLIETPGFPEYPAGHTAGSGAIVGALQNFFRTDRMKFSAFSPSSGTTRSFTQLLPGAPGGHRLARMGRDPLAHRRRCGRTNRQADRPLGTQPLLQAGPNGLADCIRPVNVRARSGPSAGCGQRRL
jgi:hypothetical protein